MGKIELYPSSCKINLDLFNAKGVMKVDKIRFKKTTNKDTIKNKLTIFIFFTQKSTVL